MLSVGHLKEHTARKKALETANQVNKPKSEIDPSLLILHKRGHAAACSLEGVVATDSVRLSVIWIQSRRHDGDVLMSLMFTQFHSSIVVPQLNELRLSCLLAGTL